MEKNWKMALGVTFYHLLIPIQEGIKDEQFPFLQTFK
jgi:hypothetical protein